MSVIASRFHNQRLVASKLTVPSALVSWMGAVQAQEYQHARWALGLRLGRATDADIRAAFDDGRILRTHILRPTWHFVAPDDIRWMLSISGPRVHAANGFWYRTHGLDSKALTRGAGVVCRALEGSKHLTRRELAEQLGAAGLPHDGQALACIVMSAELEGLICSGPRRGRQFTYALIDERVPPTPRLDPDEALGLIARRYFASHGPATIRDFTWWSGLTVAQARRAIAIAGSTLARREFDGREHWFATHARVGRAKPALVHLLPVYDEFLIAYRDRQWTTPREQAAPRYGPAEQFPHQLLIDGRVEGSWRRDERRDGHVTVAVRPQRRLTGVERTALDDAAARLARFLETEVSLEI